MYVAGGVLWKEIEESVCLRRSVVEGERGECMCCVGGVCGFEQQLQAIWARLDEFSRAVMQWGVDRSVSLIRFRSRCHGKAATRDGKWSVTQPVNLRLVGTGNLVVENMQNPSRNIACTEGEP